MTVTLAYLRARIVVLVALAAVVVSGGFIVRAFTHHVTVPCKGTLEQVSLEEVTPFAKRTEVAAGDDLKFAWDPGKETKSLLDPTAFKNVRVEWQRADGPCACATVPVPWADYTKNESVFTPNNLSIYRDTATGIFTVHDGKRMDIVAFRKTERSGTLLKKELVVAPNNLGFAILFGAFGALTAALYLLFRARPYAQRISNWHPGVLRPDGIVESPSGGTMGKVGDRVHFLDGDVLVRPEVYEGRDVYRQMPMFDRGDIAIGNHDHWVRGTLGRLRDARTLAILATGSTVLAMLANQFAG